MFILSLRKLSLTGLKEAAREEGEEEEKERGGGGYVTVDYVYRNRN